MADQKITTEVPEALKSLVRYVVVGFCSVECSLLMDLLIHHPGIKEDDVLEIIKLDRKQLRSIINTLKQDQFINSRIQMETGEDGKATRHNYYYINYSIFVNVVKYKLDQVRRKIEAMERDLTIRASFHCPCCNKSFTDLETGQLFDFQTQTYKCTYCLTEVEEEVHEGPNVDSRKLMAKFNEQLEPIYNLLHELDGIKLSDAILEPSVKESKVIKSNNSRNPNEKMTWSGDATKHFGFGFSENEITISLNNKSQNEAPKVKRELPAWMQESTVNTNLSNKTNVPNTSLTPSTFSKDNTATGSNYADNEDIMKTLLSYEKTATPVIESTFLDRNSLDETSRHSQYSTGAADYEKEMDSDEEDIVMVTIGGVKYPYNDVTPLLVSRMTQSEKEEYLKIGQELHDFYE